MKTFAAGWIRGCSGGVLGRAGRGRLDQPPLRPKTRVALTAGDDYIDQVFRGLRTPKTKSPERSATAAWSSSRTTSPSISPLSATHADCLEGILEFLKSIGKLDGTVIAESAGMGPTLEGFANYGYLRGGEIRCQAGGPDQEPPDVVHVFDQRDFRPRAVRMSRLLLDRNNFLISAAKVKTHDQVVAMLSLKNIIFGAPIKDLGLRRADAAQRGQRATSRSRMAAGFV